MESLWREGCGSVSRTNVEPHRAPPSNTFEEVLVCPWPIIQPLFLSWAQVGLDPDGAPDHLPSLSSSLSLSLSLCSGLEFPALTSNPFKCRPHFIPQRPSEEPGIESSSEIVAACAHPNKCDPSDDMEIQYMFDKCDFLIHSLPRKQDIIMADLYKRYCKFTTQLLSVSLTIQNCGFKIAWSFRGLCFC